jgi:hypothetical protein
MGAYVTYMYELHRRYILTLYINVQRACKSEDCEKRKRLSGSRMR